VTLGPRGAFGCDAREEIFSPPIRVEAVDTTGAGDIFHAGFLYSLLRGLPFREILAFANTAAGLSCRGMGGAVRNPDARGDPGGRHIDKESILLINTFFKTTLRLDMGSALVMLS